MRFEFISSESSRAKISSSLVSMRVTFAMGVRCGTGELVGVSDVSVAGVGTGVGLGEGVTGVSVIAGAGVRIAIGVSVGLGAEVG